MGYVSELPEDNGKDSSQGFLKLNPEDQHQPIKDDEANFDGFQEKEPKDLDSGDLGDGVELIGFSKKVFEELFVKLRLEGKTKQITYEAGKKGVFRFQHPFDLNIKSVDPNENGDFIYSDKANSCAILIVYGKDNKGKTQVEVGHVDAGKSMQKKVGLVDYFIEMAKRLKNRGVSGESLYFKLIASEGSYKDSDDPNNREGIPVIDGFKGALRIEAQQKFADFLRKEFPGVLERSGISSAPEYPLGDGKSEAFSHSTIPQGVGNAAEALVTLENNKVKVIATSYFE